MHRTPKVLITGIGLILTLSGFWLFYISQELLSSFDFSLRLIVTPRIQFDLYGAVIPVVISVFIFFYLFYSRGFPPTHYIYCFLLSLAFALLTFRKQGTAIVGPYLLFVLSVSFIAVLTVFSGEYFPNVGIPHLNKFQFTRGNYFTALLMTASLAPLSALTVDLTYSPFFPSIYIGAKGLTDGIMLILLSSPLGVTFATLFIILVHEMYVDVPSGELH